jgi:hypothetical protein
MVTVFFARDEFFKLSEVVAVRGYRVAGSALFDRQEFQEFDDAGIHEADLPALVARSPGKATGL